MQRSDAIERLLSDLDDHDDDERLAGNVWWDVVTAMERAWEQLDDYRAGARGAEALTRAADELHHGVSRLAAAHEQLEWLSAEEMGKARSGQRAPKSVRVMRWVAR